ncbi:M48 family metallopeptidase [Legionella pneumophila]
MNINEQDVVINDIEVRVVRKDIKNIHLGVYPPNGTVRIAVPNHVPDDQIRLAIIDKLPWIKKQQSEFSKQCRLSKREYLTGESHYFLGRRFRLDLVDTQDAPKVYLKNNNRLVIEIQQFSTLEQRQKILDEWYRKEFKKILPDLISKWEFIIGQNIGGWGIKKMKTKWGSCNVKSRRIWFNLELIKKPIECIEYVLVHEIVHFYETHHNINFKAYMDKFMPKWRGFKDVLNSLPICD